MARRGTCQRRVAGSGVHGIDAPTGLTHDNTLSRPLIHGEIVAFDEDGRPSGYCGRRRPALFRSPLRRSGWYSRALSKPWQRKAILAVFTDGKIPNTSRCTQSRTSAQYAFRPLELTTAQITYTAPSTGSAKYAANVRRA